MALIPHPSTTAYFDGTDSATIRVRSATEITVEAASDASDWTSDTGLDPIVNIEGVKEVTLVGGTRVSVAELAAILGNVDAGQIGLRMRGYDGTDNSIQFEVDSQNVDLNASNDNLKYRGLRLVLRDMRHGPWLGAVADYNNATAYTVGNKVFYASAAGVTGTAYICILNSTGNLPTNATYWAIHNFSSGDRISYVRNADNFGFVSLGDSNTEQPIPADYSSGTTYAAGDRAFYGGTAYKSLAAGNIAHTPSSSPTWWVPYYSEKWTLHQFVGELSYGTSRQSYVFCYTLVNDWQEEGPPSDPVSIDADYGEQITLHGYIGSLTSNHYQDYRKAAVGASGVGYKIRYYGFVADSTGGGEMRLIHETDEVGTSGTAFGLLIETRPADWEEVLTTTTFDLPPASPIAIAAGANGMIGAITKDYFAACEPFKGWAWPVEYRKPLPARAVGLLGVPGGWLVTTQKQPWFVAGPVPEQLSKMELPVEQAGISQAAMCSLGELGAAYASHDGIVLVQGLGATVATGTLFTRREWRARYADLLSKMRLGFHDGRLVCIFPGTAQSEASNYHGFIIRFDEGQPMYSRIAINGSGLAIDTLRDQLLVGNLTGFGAFEEGVYLPLTWQSKEFLTARPENMGAVMLEYSGGPLSIDIHANGVNKLTKTLPYAATRVEARYRLPSGYKAQHWSAYVTEGVPLTYSALTTYALNDTATYGGVPWLSLQAANLNHTPATGSAWWVQIGGETVHRLLLATTMAELGRA